MKKLVIRQSSSRMSHFPSQSYVENILDKNIDVPYSIKPKGKSTLSIMFEEHIDTDTLNTLAKKLGLKVSHDSDHRWVLYFPY